MRFWSFVLGCFLFSSTASAAKLSEAYPVACSPKLDRFTCERQIDILRDILSFQRVPLPQGWRWVIVDDSEWPVLQQYYRLRYDFVFSHMREQRTVIKSSFFIRFERAVWERGIAHESAHIVCDLVDEGRANQAAQRIAYRGFRSMRESCGKSEALAKGD